MENLSPVEIWCVEHAIKQCVENGAFGSGQNFVKFEKKVVSSKVRSRCNILFGKIFYTRDDSSDAILTQDIVVKLYPDIYRWELNTFEFFTEISVYTKFLPLFREISKDSENMFPKFFHGSFSFDARGENSAIVIEDVGSRGFRLSKNKIFMDLAHLELSLDMLGKFHALSYEAKNRKPKTFQKYLCKILESDFLVANIMPGFIDETCKRGLLPLISENETVAGEVWKIISDPKKILSSDPYGSKKLKNALRVAENPQPYLVKVLTTQNEPLSVLCHGDFVRNNVFFKYQDDLPKFIELFDFGKCRYASPIIDLCTLLYISVDQETRAKHWDRLIDIYYNSLKNTFPENPLVPTKKAILDDFKGKAFFAYILASFFLPDIVNKVREEEKFEKENESCGEKKEGKFEKGNEHCGEKKEEKFEKENEHRGDKKEENSEKENKHCGEKKEEKLEKENENCGGKMDEKSADDRTEEVSIESIPDEIGDCAKIEKSLEKIETAHVDAIVSSVENGSTLSTAESISEESSAHVDSENMPPNDASHSDVPQVKRSVLLRSDDAGDRPENRSEHCDAENQSGRGSEHSNDLKELEMVSVRGDVAENVSEDSSAQVEAGNTPQDISDPTPAEQESAASSVGDLIQKGKGGIPDGTSPWDISDEKVADGYLKKITKMLTQRNLTLGGEEVTKMLTDIVKDMVDRKFV